MGGRVQRAKKTVEERIPALLVGPSHTMSCALHSVWYEGPLHEWTTFEQDATAEFQQHAWERHNSTITIRPVGQLGPHNIANVQLFIGDEKGLQGRFNQNVCHVMSAVFGSQGLNLRFGDFKSTNSTGRRIPDVVMMNQVHEVKVAGELKTQWVDQHNLNDDPLQNYDTEELFRKQIGQLARYMQDLGLPIWVLLDVPSACLSQARACCRSLVITILADYFRHDATSIRAHCETMLLLPWKGSWSGRSDC